MFYMDEQQLPDFLNTTLSAAFFDISEEVSFIIFIHHAPISFTY